MRKVILLVALAATLSGCTPAVILMTPTPRAAYQAPNKVPQKMSVARGQ